MLENQRGLTPTPVTEPDGCLCEYLSSTESEECLFQLNRRDVY